MNEAILNETRKFLVHYLKGKKCDYNQYHPWREPWEFVVLHSFRVEQHVVKLLKQERHSLTPNEVLLTRLAAILHDIGRIHQREDHGAIGRTIAEEWLYYDKSILEAGIDCDRLLRLIDGHSRKEEPDEDFCSRILKDADVLDEIGVISIFMASSWIDRGNPYFFALLKQRVETREIDFCDEMLRYLYTDSAKEILQQKKAFIQGFVKQLDDEIIGTVEFGNIALEEHFACNKAE